MNLRSLITKRMEVFHRVLAEAKTAGAKEHYLLQYKRWLCRNDLFFLTCITGHERIAQWGDFYRPFCDEVSLMNWKVVQLGIHEAPEMSMEVPFDIPMQRLYLRYRGYYKTTIVTICHTAQLLLNFNNIHVVLCHNKQRTSSDNLVAIKNLFLNKPSLSKDTKKMLKEQYGIYSRLCIRELFPECVPPGKEWGSAEKFSLYNRTDMQRPEDSVEAVGVDTEITGGHWQIAKKNDLVTEKSVNTEEQIKKTLDWDSRFNKGHFDQLNQPLQDYEGTRYHFADMYSAKLNDDRLCSSEVSIVKDLDKFKAGDDTQIVHRERYNRKDIEDLMSDDMWVFMCQLMLKPEDPEKMQFNSSMIKYYDTIPEGCYNYLLIDPATAQKKKSDYTVMLVVGVIVIENKVCKYVLDGIRDKIDTKKRVDTAIELAMKYNVKDIGWEAIGFQETDIYYFEERRRKEGFRLSPTAIKSHSGSKEDRIRGLIPEYSNGEWLWAEKGKIVKQGRFSGKNYDLTEEMELEMMSFPLAQHDDLCFVAGTKISTPFGYKNIEEINIGDFVITPQGVQRVLNSGFTGERKVVTRLGLTGTPKHPVLCGDSFDSLDSLCYSDVNKISQFNLKEILKWRYQSLLNSMELSSEGWVARKDIISLSQIPIEDGKILKDFMLRFGNFITKKEFQKVSTFTTLMATLLTTTYQTLFVFHIANILRSLKIWILRKTKSTWRELGHLLYYGINLKKVEDGISSMAKTFLEILNPQNIFASSVHGSFNQKENLPFVQIIVDKNSIKSLEDGMNKGSVIRVARSLESKSTAQGSLVLAYVDIPDKQKVYNLTIENESVYYANDILVSNCDAMTFLNRLNITKPIQRKIIEERTGMTFGEYQKSSAKNRNKSNWGNTITYA